MKAFYIPCALVAILIQFLPLLGAKKIYVYADFWGPVFNIPANAHFQGSSQIPSTFHLLQPARNCGFELVRTHTLKGLTDADLIITFDIPINCIEEIKQYAPDKLVAFLWEPPSVRPYSYEKKYHALYHKIYTWRDDLVDNIKYFKFHYAVLQPMISPTITFNRKSFCTMICKNKESSHPDELYNERIATAEWFEHNYPDKFDLYGLWWDPKKHPSYKGAIEDKIAITSHYKFCICYENIKNISGYVSEKIFDCFTAGCVPVYWGANNITDFIPETCFIDRRKFASNQELYDFLVTIDENTYQEYIDAIKIFLSSKEAQKFSIQHLIHTFLDLFSTTFGTTHQ